MDLVDLQLAYQDRGLLRMGRSKKLYLWHVVFLWKEAKSFETNLV